MCGIAGWVGRAADEAAVDAMVASVAARGPDGRQVTRASPACVLGHSRLAIIDLTDAGRQPMRDTSGRFWTVVNGEIYNHLELRAELLRAGCHFSSDSDSEVVLHGFALWGEAVLRRLQGIFALALYDAATDHLLLARDRVGVKPLYYAVQGGQIVFGSELKAVLASGWIQPEYLPDTMQVYLAHRYLPAPLTPYRDVWKLPPAHVLRFHAGHSRTMRYWQAELRSHDDQGLAAELAQAINESIGAQMMSDAPVGVLLSGGIDSSSVATIAAQRDKTLRAFCCGFDEKTHDERPFAREAAACAGVPLHELVMDWVTLKRHIPMFIDWFDEPFFNYSAVAIYGLSELAREQHIKVLLAGEGADELFAGYLWYDDFALQEHLDPERSLGRFFSYYGFLTAEMQDLLAQRKTKFDHLAILREHDRPELDPVSRAQWLDFHTFLPDDILCRDDRASMAAGIELRVPFLDERLLDRFFLLPQSLLYAASERKALLKHALSGRVPPKILTTRKKGFGFPLYAWDCQIREMTRELTENGLLVSFGHATPDGLRSALQTYSVDAVWLLLTAELWLRRFIGNQPLEGLLDEPRFS
jgi:asparagine synthase (glutamine-hydrolysing)